MEKALNISYEEYAGINELQAEDRQLIEAAKEAVSYTYSPYSKMRVGAAVRYSVYQYGADGNNTVIERGIACGSNQENVAYSNCLCAERVAMSCAAMKGEGQSNNKVQVEAIAICSTRFEQDKWLLAPPCGTCRQALIEAENNWQRSDPKANIRVIMYSSDRILIFHSVQDMLPIPFINHD